MISHLLKSRTSILAAGFLTLVWTAYEAEASDPQVPDISFAIHKLKEPNSEGPDVERTYFTAGTKRIVLGEPKDCRLSADGGSFLLLPISDGFDGEIRVSRSPFTPASNFAENALTYRDSAEQGVPKDATNLEAKPPMLNPYPYNEWKSIGFTWTYSSYGHSVVRTVSYVNLEIGVQIMVTTQSAKNDAEKVSKIARQFMSSWWVMSERKG